LEVRGSYWNKGRGYILTVVGILGMTHDEELQKKYRYPLTLLKELILDFNPDVICGEVHPQSWKPYFNGMSLMGF
jgi:hypothetical protein